MVKPNKTNLTRLHGSRFFPAFVAQFAFERHGLLAVIDVAVTIMGEVDNFDGVVAHIGTPTVAGDFEDTVIATAFETITMLARVKLPAHLSKTIERPDSKIARKPKLTKRDEDLIFRESVTIEEGHRGVLKAQENDRLAFVVEEIEKTIRAAVAAKGGSLG